LVLADFDADGSLDAAVTNMFFAGNSVTVLLNSPVVALYPSALTFAPQTVGTTSNAKTETISNPGSPRLKIFATTVTGTDPDDFVVTSNCPKSLAEDKNCAVNVEFKPSAKGKRTAEMKITDNALGKTQYIFLQGTGK
jgi:hypothetical protein